VVSQNIAIQVLAVLGVLILGYSFLVRPQMKRIKENEKLLTSLKIGDKVVMGGGLIGKITKFEGSRIVEIEMSKSIHVLALRSGIESKFEE